MHAMQRLVSRGGLKRLQWGVLFYHDHPKEIAIIGDDTDPAAQALVEEVYREYVPIKVVAACSPQQANDADALPLFKGKTLINGRSAAYICRDYVCGKPVTTPADLANQLLQHQP